MTTVATLHFLALMTCYCVFGTGCFALFMADRLLGQCHALRFKTAGVILSTAGAMWWIFATWCLQGASSCKEDSLFCIAAGSYHLTRNMAFLLFHVAIMKDVWRLDKQRRRAKANKAKRRNAKKLLPPA